MITDLMLCMTKYPSTPDHDVQKVTLNGTPPYSTIMTWILSDGSDSGHTFWAQ